MHTNINMHTHVRDSKANPKERNPQQQGQITIGIMTAKSQVEHEQRGACKHGRARHKHTDTQTTRAGTNTRDAGEKKIKKKDNGREKQKRP